MRGVVQEGAEARRIASFVELIGDGEGTRALATTLTEAEQRLEALRTSSICAPRNAGAGDAAPSASTWGGPTIRRNLV